MKEIDHDNSRTIDKNEMKIFVRKLMEEQENLQFKEFQSSRKHKEMSKGKTFEQKENFWAGFSTCKKKEEYAEDEEERESD